MELRFPGPDDFLMLVSVLLLCFVLGKSFVVLW